MLVYQQHSGVLWLTVDSASTHIINAYLINDEMPSLPSSLATAETAATLQKSIWNWTLNIQGIILEESHTATVVSLGLTHIHIPLYRACFY